MKCVGRKKKVRKKRYGHLLFHYILCSFFPLVSNQTKPYQLLLLFSQFWRERVKKEILTKREEKGMLSQTRHKLYLHVFFLYHTDTIIWVDTTVYSLHKNKRFPRQFGSHAYTETGTPWLQCFFGYYSGYYIGRSSPPFGLWIS